MPSPVGYSFLNAGDVARERRNNYGRQDAAG